MTILGVVCVPGVGRVCKDVEASVSVLKAEIVNCANDPVRLTEDAASLLIFKPKHSSRVLAVVVTRQDTKPRGLGLVESNNRLKREQVPRRKRQGEIEYDGMRLRDPKIVHLVKRVPSKSKIIRSSIFVPMSHGSRVIICRKRKMQNGHTILGDDIPGTGMESRLCSPFGPMTEW